ncbi:MAG: ornithine decarboxylase [Rhodospirillaceae bacterium]|nr:ornithine decarboxylase [Rhodospirillaceae bacterium]|tara:strand:+ start:19310 stop:20440 length:1131 start_codon:yes stop_codon:yes gene_type:complete
MTEKIQRFLVDERPETPCLVVDLDVVKSNFLQLKEQLSEAEIFYAVKANPAEPILSLLRDHESNFDAASIFEIEQCLALGVAPEKISFGHTIKKQSHIKRAFDAGIRLFAFDSIQELEKLSISAPGASVFCRILTPNDGADWPLSDKFGCVQALAVDLLCQASDMGLVPAGVSFHVGSQQRNPSVWGDALAKSAEIFAATAKRGVTLSLLNLGGGFPSQYKPPMCELSEHIKAIKDGLRQYFGDSLPRIIAEPGRYIPGDAGIIQSEVVLISQKSLNAEKRWVYLDIGKFGGLPEVLDEAIKYRICTPHDGEETGPVVIAGPTCDEVDVIYEESDYELPLNLAIGDRVEILSAGAYTASYSSVGFNGFPPLKEYYI